ncbi:hypothetical protein OG21DRAFT_943348 [Imleria badia]|nr:hypothetical protein OG21DRAFT_943348 [Imleria badia]
MCAHLSQAQTGTGEQRSITLLCDDVSLKTQRLPPPTASPLRARRVQVLRRYKGNGIHHRPIPVELPPKAKKVRVFDGLGRFESGRVRRLGNTPVTGLILAHHGASVIRIDGPSPVHQRRTLRRKTLHRARHQESSRTRGRKTSHRRRPTSSSILLPCIFELLGHDINYIALSGILSMLTGTSKKPSLPLNLGDFGCGGLLCVIGILLARVDAVKSSMPIWSRAHATSPPQHPQRLPLLL